jgi:hypothetical protein
LRARRLGRLTTVACAAILLALGFRAAEAASAATRIVAPANDQLVTDGPLRAVVKLAPGAGSFRAWVDSKEVTRRFSGGKRRVASLGTGGLSRGTHFLYAQTERPGGGRQFQWARFVVAKRSPSLLGASRPRLGARGAPVVVSASQGAAPRLRATLNGNRIDDAFVHSLGDTRKGRLGANDGVRYGRNRLRLVSIHENGTYDVEHQRFTVPRRVPVASAGRDRSTIVGQAVRLNGRASTLPRGGKPTYRWRVVSTPNAAAASGAAKGLRGVRSARPEFAPSQAGTYLVRVAVRRRGRAATSRDTVVVNAAPADPPIGAPIETIADPAGHMTIDGANIDGTGTGGIAYTLLSRTTRKAPTLCKSTVAFSGSVEASAAGVQKLEQLVADCNDPKYLLALGAVSGVPAGTVAELRSLAASVGGRLSDVDQSLMRQGAPFSLIGSPTAPDDSAFVNVGGNTGTGSRLGTLSGYLQVNGAIGEYGFVFGEFETFDTAPESTASSHSAIQVGPTTLDHAVASDFKGFQVAVVDRYSLDVIKDQMFATNTGDPATDAANLNAMASMISRGSVLPYELVLIRSYGAVGPTTPAWDTVAQAIERLGGTRTVFNRLEASKITTEPGYSFVGALDDVEAAEASQPLGDSDGRLAGIMGRNRTARYDPALSDPVGTADPDLVSLVYQAPQAFPAFGTAGLQGANAYIARKLFTDAVSPPDLRAQYWLNWSADWNNKRTTLTGLAYPGDSACSCSADEFTEVKTQLDSEVAKLIDVKTWIASMQATLDPTKSAFDLMKIAHDIQVAVNPPPRNTDGDASQVLNAALGIAGTLLEGPIGVSANLTVTGFGLIAGLQSGADGSALLGDIEAKATSLNDELFTRFQLARSALTGMGKIMVSDYGKLTDAAAHINSDWAWPADDTPVRTTINKGTKQWFYSELMPVAWQRWWIRGARNARDWVCGEPHTRYYKPIYPFRGVPDSSQYDAVVGFTSNPVTPLTNRYSLGVRSTFDGAWESWNALAPPAEMTDALFKPLTLDLNSNTLGLHPQTFFEDNFEPNQTPVENDHSCPG